MTDLSYFCTDILSTQPMIHYFQTTVTHIPLPEKFTYPFHYTPHPLCVIAAEEVKSFLSQQEEWKKELQSEGKMFGVLIVRTKNRQVGYLTAFSGNICGSNIHDSFVPPVYDLLQPDGFFKIEEEQISLINSQIRALENDDQYLELKQRHSTLRIEMEQRLREAKVELKEAKEKREIRRSSANNLSEEEKNEMVKESQYQKAEFKRLEKDFQKSIEELKGQLAIFEAKIESLKTERKMRSAALQQKLFEQFRMLNACGEEKDLCQIFEQTVHKTPPAGAGECALPKLLQYAYLHQLEPLAMGEFWWGKSPKTEIRHHGYFYPSCKGKCEPILKHMLQGLEVEQNPLTQSDPHENEDIETIFEDEWLVVINKPAGLLSVPGKETERDSVYQLMRNKYPDASGPLIVHRLDMATSGLLLIAKTKEVHQNLQSQFSEHLIKKRYVALLDGEISEPKGTIDLPLSPNPLDRPRQIVDYEQGKPAITHYKIESCSNQRTRILFFPITGRTHQLRVHAAHPEGLNSPIIGDELYGKKDTRLFLHAEYLEFKHPIYGDKICLQKEAEF